MGNKKCKDANKNNVDTKDHKGHKYKCKKCNSTANKEKKLCKPVKV